MSSFILLALNDSGNFNRKNIAIRKIAALTCAAVLAISLSACSSDSSDDATSDSVQNQEEVDTTEGFQGFGVNIGDNADTFHPDGRFIQDGADYGGKKDQVINGVGGFVIINTRDAVTREATGKIINISWISDSSFNSANVEDDQKKIIAAFEKTYGPGEEIFLSKDNTTATQFVTSDGLKYTIAINRGGWLTVGLVRA